MEPTRIKVIRGIDNLSDNVKLNPAQRGIFLREADNVDIDDEGMPHRRDGYGEKVLNSPTITSFWSDGEVSLFVDGTSLKRLETDYKATTLVTGMDPMDRMCFLSKDGTIFFSNHSIIGYIKDGLPYPFPNPGQPFKTKMIGGQILEFYNSRLYAANGPHLFFSDATVLMRMDKRKNAIAFPGYITMLKAVLDGLYVSVIEKDKGQVFFLKGADPSEFIQFKVSDLAALEGTSVMIEDDDIGKGAQGKVAYWVATDGSVYKGLPGGVVIQCQQGLFEMKDLERGTSIIKDDHGYTQYLAVCSLKPGVGGIEGGFRVPRVVVSSG